MSDGEQRDASDSEVNAEGSVEKQPAPFTDEQMQMEIKCKTSDGGVINVRVSHLLQSSVFKNMWKDLDMSPKDLEEFEFKVNVETNIFSKVVEWMGEHIGKPDPKIEDDPATRQRKPLAFSEYETDFFKVGVEEIANMIKAANYLDIKSLYYSGCQALANVIGNKTPEELRELFGLEDDLTEDEKADIRRRNMWCNY
uniref:Skp1-related protein n=2 Tax=Meloidogyne incognita group TaxID=654580 RepID=A0A914LFQ2_MELIC